MRVDHHSQPNASPNLHHFADCDPIVYSNKSGNKENSNSAAAADASNSGIGIIEEDNNNLSGSEAMLMSGSETAAQAIVSTF